MASESSWLSLDRIEQAVHHIDPVFLNTPQFQSGPLSAQLRLRLTLKVETINPIGCFKGRGASNFVAHLSSQPGPKPKLVCASAGNFGQGLAYAARIHNLKCTVFAAENANALKLDRIRKLGAEVELRGADFDAAKDAARESAHQSDDLFVEDGREPAIAEGAGSIAIELCRLSPKPDILLVPLGNGALIGGVSEWMKAHSPGTRIVAVCPEGAPSMALSLQQKKVVTTPSINTIGDGLGVRVPVPEALHHIQGLIDEVLLVSDAAMVQAMKSLFQHHRLISEPSGAAGVAAATVYRDRFADANVATLICGSNVTDEQLREWRLL